jgi:hypothetical protein
MSIKGLFVGAALRFIFAAGFPARMVSHISLHACII